MGEKPKKSSVEDAVASGNENIIEFLVSLNCSFSNTLIYAIQSHHNKLAFWLMDNYDQDPYSTTDCIKCYNIEMFFYFYFNPNCGYCSVHFDDPFLVSCSITSNYDLAMYLLSKGEDPLMQNEDGNNAIFYAYDQELKKLLEKYC